MSKKFNNEERNINVEFSTEEKFYINFNDSKKKIKVNSKSELFRNLYNLGIDVNEISRLCESHYSFVHGVISKSCEMRENNKSSKSDEIRKMFDDGKKVGEIAKELNSNYSFVHTVVKKYKQLLEVK